MMTSHPFSNMRADYVLGLLSDDEKNHFEHHLSSCPSCRAALESDRQVGRLVKQMLHTKGNLSPARARTLMPKVPVRKTGPRLPLWRTGWAQPMTLAGIILALVVGFFNMGINGSPAAVAATATITQTVAVQTVDDVGVESEFPVPTMTPSPTPIAQLPAVEPQPQSAPAP